MRLEEFGPAFPSSGSESKAPLRATPQRISALTATTSQPATRRDGCLYTITVPARLEREALAPHEADAPSHWSTPPAHNPSAPMGCCAYRQTALKHVTTKARQRSPSCQCNKTCMTLTLPDKPRRSQQSGATGSLALDNYSHVDQIACSALPIRRRPIYYAQSCSSRLYDICMRHGVC